MSAATCVDSMVLPYCSLSSFVCVHFTGIIDGVSLLATFMFSPESIIAKF